VGAFAVSGLWLAIIGLLVYGGIASMIMGIVAEDWTARELRSQGLRHWRLVNGVRLRPFADIDHVLVGPPGVFVVETKWSSDTWPAGINRDSFMVSRLESAIDQVQARTSDFQHHFSRVLAGAPVYSVCVLWDAELWGSEVETSEVEGVVVLGGAHLRGWLDDQIARLLEDDRIENIWSALEVQEAKRERRDLENSVAVRPTLNHLALGVVLPFLLGCLIPLYLSPLVARWTHGYGLDVVLLATLSLVALASTRVGRLRALSWGACLSSGLLLLATLGYVLTRHI